jgi:ectoine hydroxylase
MTDLVLEPPPRATLAAICLPTDLTLDAEGPALFARVPSVRLRVQKLALDGDTLSLESYRTAEGRIGDAAATLRPVGSIDAIGLACTSLAFTLGVKNVQAELRRAHPNAFTTDMASALLAALDHVGVRRPALLTPYVDELHARNLDLLAAAGMPAVAHRNLGLRTDGEITRISQASLAELAAAVDTPEADVVVLGCSAFRACTPGFIDALETALAKPVITSQQAFLWHLLRSVGLRDVVGGYGSLWSRAQASPVVVVVRTTVVQARERPPDLYPSRVQEPSLVPRLDPVTSSRARSVAPLLPHELDGFERSGVLVLRQVFAPEEVAVLRAHTEALRGHYESLSYEALDQSTDMRVITERGGTLASGGSPQPILKSIWQIHLPPEFAPHMRESGAITRRTVCDARLVGAARQILGEEVYVHQSRINYQVGYRDGGTGGSGFLWHQDFEQWHCEDGMPRMRAVSMAVLLERAVPANGALMVMPGSHRHLVQAYGEPDASEPYARGALSRGPRLPARLLRDLADRHGIVHCTGEPGDVVLFDCNTLHGSHTNISPWGRSMLFAVYNAVSNVPAPVPYASARRRPEHIGSHDPQFAGVPLPSLAQVLTHAAGREGGV